MLNGCSGYWSIVTELGSLQETVCTDG